MKITFASQSKDVSKKGGQGTWEKILVSGR